MATKAEYLTALAARVSKVISTDLAHFQGGVSLYDSTVLIDQGDGTFNRVTQPFIVVDEGTPRESAVDRERVIENKEFNVFLSGVNTAIADFKVANPTVKSLAITEVNLVAKYAILAAFTVVLSSASKTQKFVFDDKGTIKIVDYA